MKNIELCLLMQIANEVFLDVDDNDDNANIIIFHC